MWVFGSQCDEFYVATRLFLKLDLSPTRESLLHFCERIRRAYPTMRRLRRREDGGIILDEEDDRQRGRRYLRLHAEALRFGLVDPPDRGEVTAMADLILNQAPAHLSLSDLDYHSLEVAYGFDLEYAGNHDEIVAETLLGENPLHAALAGGNRRVIDCQPCLGVSLSDDFATQAYLDVKGRTSMHELRIGEFEPQVLSVYLTLRREFPAGTTTELAGLHQSLLELGEELAVTRVIPQIVRPLREAIATHH